MTWCTISSGAIITWFQKAYPTIYLTKWKFWIWSLSQIWVFQAAKGCTSSNDIWRNLWCQTISDNISQDILTQIFDVIQSNQMSRYKFKCIRIMDIFQDFLLSADFFQNHHFQKFVINHLDPDDAPGFIVPDLGPNCMQILSAENTRNKCCLESLIATAKMLIIKIENSLDPDQDVLV